MGLSTIISTVGKMREKNNFCKITLKASVLG